jgi:hypothetical protein
VWVRTPAASLPAEAAREADLSDAAPLLHPALALTGGD